MDRFLDRFFLPKEVNIESWNLQNLFVYFLLKANHKSFYVINRLIPLTRVPSTVSHLTEVYGVSQAPI